MKSSIGLIAANAHMRELLTGALTEHGIPFHSRGKAVMIDPGSGGGIAQAPSSGRVIALLREVLSAPERESVSVVEELDFPGEFPVTTRLEAWWSVFETSWFEKAMAEDAFSIWFQPVVDTVARRNIGYECLLRLTKGHRREGAEIMAAASARRNLSCFDSYARKLAIGTAAVRWHADALCFLNFIPSTIRRPAYCLRETLQAVRESGIPPESFVMEAVQANRNPDIAHLRRIADYLREQGLRFGLDDVGADAEALRLVCELRPDYIKLAKAATDRMDEHRSAGAVQKLVDLAERFNVRAVAKGVTSASAMELLGAAGVRYMQGHWFGSPAQEIGGMRHDLDNLSRAIRRSAPSAVLHAGLAERDPPPVPAHLNQ